MNRAKRRRYNEKVFLYHLRIALILGLLSLQGWANPVVYEKKWVGSTPVHVVTVDLNSRKIAVRPLLAQTGHALPLQQLLGSHPPIAAITGTFFDTRTAEVVGNLVSQGRMLTEGDFGTTLAIDGQGRGDILNSAGRLGRYHDWSRTQFAISGGPTLLVSGVYFLLPQGEGFRDPSLFLPCPRTALGLTAANKLLMVTCSRRISLWQLAKIMKQLGARQAINLDGGSSTAFFYRGHTLVAPRRPLTNLVGVFPVSQLPLAAQRKESLSQRGLALYQKGIRQLRLGRLIEARSSFRLALSKDPNQARYWSAYGLCEERLGSGHQPGDAYLRAAHLYLDHFKTQEAMKLARRATRLNPDRAAAQLLLGLTAFQNHQIGLARQALLAVLRQHPGHPRAARTLLALEQGEQQKRPRGWPAIRRAALQLVPKQRLLVLDATGWLERKATTTCWGRFR